MQVSPSPKPVSSYFTALCSPPDRALELGSLPFEDININTCLHCMLLFIHINLTLILLIICKSY